MIVSLCPHDDHIYDIYSVCHTIYHMRNDSFCDTFCAPFSLSQGEKDSVILVISVVMAALMALVVLVVHFMNNQAISYQS